MFGCRKVWKWDLILPHAEFAYYNYVKKSTSKIPFEIVYGLSLRQPIDLLSLPTDYRLFNYAQAFTKHIHNLDVEIRCKIILSNDTYKLVANAY